MDPATLALILSGIAAATKHTVELVELLRKYRAGEIDESEALRRYAVMQPDYKGARDEWDAVGQKKV